eukprot:13918555-Ditylum_brightwellii.AAC.1
MDTLHLQRTNAGCTDNDAKACYDCIIPIILLLAYIKAGLSYNAGVFFSHILYNMQYHLTTAFGIASPVNYYSLITAIFGIGHGPTDRPHGWACISDVILKCYHCMCRGCTIHNPGCDITVKCNTVMLMDGNTLMYNSEEFDISPQ